MTRHLFLSWVFLDVPFNSVRKGLQGTWKEAVPALVILKCLLFFFFFLQISILTNASAGILTHLLTVHGSHRN